MKFDFLHRFTQAERLSRPVWGAWIEMDTTLTGGGLRRVAPRMGRVD